MLSLPQIQFYLEHTGLENCQGLLHSGLVQVLWEMSLNLAESENKINAKIP